MGAEPFQTIADGKTADAAFDAAVSTALHYHGHGGYTGTIAEKSEFEMVSVAQMTHGEAYALATRLINDGDPRIDDKNGPAGCIPLGTGEFGEFLFFGWAAS